MNRQKFLRVFVIANILFGAHSAFAGCGPDARLPGRTITLQREHGLWGAAQHAALPLNKGEVVLTFDDGPRPETTPLVLKALADECVSATFFMVGDNMAQFPELARRVVRQGNSAGMHSYAHPHLGTLKPAEQLADLKQTQDAYQAALGTTAPAYRFPFLEETQALMEALKAGKVAVFSIDMGIGDWEPDVNTDVLVGRLLENLKTKDRGIILMHDAYGPLAGALPALLKTLKENGYQVVHLKWDN